MPRVLVIEDEQSIRDTVQDILELEGFEALGAENGAVGIQLAKQFAPDLIICDVMMPEIDGYSVLKMLHQESETAAIPFIFLTAKADRSSMRYGMNLGADDYLTKPFTPQELLEVLSTRLHKHSNQLQPLVHKINDLAVKLNYQTYHDPFTHLPNLLSLQQSFEKLQDSAEHDYKLIPLLHLNLEQLSRIRAALGQDSNNRLLELVSSRLTCLDYIDSVAYVSSHRLAILVQPISILQTIEPVIERILDAFSQPFQLNQQELFLAPRIGVSWYPQHGECVETLNSKAEIALTSTAKFTKATVSFYSPHQQVHLVNRFEIEVELHHALKRNQFEVYYQPQVDLETGQLVGAEALLRWNHPERGMIPPSTFIPIAEETGLIVSIGEWVLHTACAQAKQWQADQPNLQLAVNISCRQFMHHELLSRVLQILGDTGLSAAHLELEITESTLMEDPQLALQLLNALRQHRIRIAIDDFGVGYSSFNYLQQFPLDTLKIDSCFVRNLGGSLRNQKIVSAIIQMAHDMNLQVIAEGVEQDSEVHVLRQFQCDTAQGYWFGEARSAPEFEQEFMAI